MESDPEVVVIDVKADGPDTRGIRQLISSLKSSFRLPDFNKLEEYLTLREEKMKRDKEELEAKMRKASEALSAEIERRKMENELLEEKHANEVLQKLIFEEELRKCRRDCDDLEEKVNRLSEDERVMLGREKRGEERYGKLLEELRKNEECVAQLNSRNRELDLGKRKVEAEIEIWKKRFGEMEPRVSALEQDTKMLKRTEPNFCQEMNDDLGVRNAGFDEWIKVKKEIDIESTSVNLGRNKTNEPSAKENHALPNVSLNCNTPPTQRIEDLLTGGNGRPTFITPIDISDSEDEMPKVTRSASTKPASSKGVFNKQQIKQEILSGTTQEDKLQRKQEILDPLGGEDNLKRKQTSPSTRHLLFPKQQKTLIKAEAKTWDAFNVSDSDDSSTGSGPLDPV